MSLDRRQFLTAGHAHLDSLVFGVIITTGAAGVAWQWHAERKLRDELIAKTTPVLERKSQEELARIPSEGELDIKKFFNGLTNKVPVLAAVICSEEFVTALAGMPTDEAKQAVLAETFTRLVVSEAQIMARVEAAADRLGGLLDQNWADCCLALADLWRLSLQSHDGGVGSRELLRELETTIRSRLKQTLDAALGNDQMPFLRSAEKSLGKSALLLLPLTQVTERLYLPTFWLQEMQTGLEHVLRYLRDRKDDFKYQIGSVFVDLCNGIGEAFRTALHLRICDLHAWQKDALLASVARHARRATAWFG